MMGEDERRGGTRDASAGLNRLPSKDRKRLAIKAHDTYRGWEVDGLNSELY